MDNTNHACSCIGLLKEVARSFFECKVPDVKICPISITYERVVEESLMIRELLGAAKPPESTSVW